MHVLMKQPEKSRCELNKNVNNDIEKGVRQFFFFFIYIRACQCHDNDSCSMCVCVDESF